jgi:predicted branched-subunit amino acid permease
MRTVTRTADRALVRDVAAIAAACAAVGASFGAITVAAGLPSWSVPAMSMLVFAGGAQFMAVGLIAAGDPVAAFPAGLLALLLPSLRDRETRLVAAIGATAAVLTTPLLPAGLPVLLALVGLVVLAVPRRPQTGADPGEGRC